MQEPRSKREYQVASIKKIVRNTMYQVRGTTNKEARNKMREPRLPVDRQALREEKRKNPPQRTQRAYHGESFFFCPIGSRCNEVKSESRGGVMIFRQF